MINKVFAAVVVCAVAFTAPAMAQVGGKGNKGDKAGRRGGQHQMSPKLIKELNLTPEQQEKIKAIQDAQKAKIQPIRDNAKLTPEEKKEQMKPILKDGMKQILDILTPEQKTKLKELREKQKEQREHKEEKEEKEDKKEDAKP